MITPELQRRAEDIFFELVERGASAAEVAAECGDDDQLRAEVESLLANHRAEAVFLNTGKLRAIAQPVGVPPLAAQSRVGGYTILGALGTGGMGVVYVAQQERPRRTVALKLIRRELASPGMLRRFEHEAEMLGRLQHPGIAQIFEAGAADDGGGGPGQPFIAMELVNGPPLTQHADQKRLGTRQRLELFLGVCEAVQHAHQRGVIHRDLKPANILVDEHVSPPRTKILDFGVSRLADPDVQGLTQHTSQGQLIGTLPYMSPEQVVGDPAEIDTRADVYALGVVLYQLLSGRLPLEVASRSIPEAARVIRDDAPARLGTINRELRGDLETIVATALEKDKARRYQSASELADDIRRFLDGRPIAAKDASALDLLSRQIRRYRGTVAVGSASIVALVALAGFALRQSAQNQKLAVSEAASKTDALLALEAARTLRAKADETAGRLEIELTASRVERGRLLGRTGNLAAAEDLIWPEHLKDPGSKQTYWALWELYSRQPCVAAARGHSGSVRGVALSADGSLLLSAAEDGLVKVWNTTAMRCDRVLDGGVGKLTDLSLSADGTRAAWCGTDGGLVVWTIGSESWDWIATAHQGGAACLAFSPDGRRVVSAGDDRVIRVWDASGGPALAEFAGHEAAITDLAISPDGEWIASGLADSTVRLLSTAAGSEPRTLRGHSQMITAVAFSPDGRTLVTGSGDRRILEWDLERGVVTGELVASNGFVRPLMFGPQGRTLVSGGWWTMDLWDVAARRRVRSVSLPESSVSGALSADGGTAAIGFGNGQLRVWEVGQSETAAAGGGAATPLPGHVGRTNLALSPDVRVVATGDGSGLLRLWETRRPQTGGAARLLSQWPGHTAGVRTLEFSPDGALLATGGDDGMAKVWDLATGRLVGSVEKSDFVSTRALSFTPDGTLLAVARQDTSVTLHRLPGMEVARTLPPVQWQVVSVDFSARGDSIAAASRDRTMRLWPLRENEPPEATILSGQFTPWTTAFTPDGARIAIGDWGKGIQIWELKNRESIVRLDGHTGLVTAVDYMPGDPGVLVSSSADGTVRLWDSASGRGLLTLEAFQGWDAVSMAIGSDGRTLVASSLNGEAAVWDLAYYDRHITGNLKMQLSRRGALMEGPAGAAAAERLRAWAAGVLNRGPSSPAGGGIDPETIASWGREIPAR